MNEQRKRCRRRCRRGGNGRRACDAPAQTRTAVRLAVYLHNGEYANETVFAFFFAFSSILFIDRLICFAYFAWHIEGMRRMESVSRFSVFTMRTMCVRVDYGLAFPFHETSRPLYIQCVHITYSHLNQCCQFVITFIWDDTDGGAKICAPSASPPFRLCRLLSLCWCASDLTSYNTHTHTIYNRTPI